MSIAQIFRYDIWGQIARKRKLANEICGHMTLLDISFPTQMLVYLNELASQPVDNILKVTQQKQRNFIFFPKEIALL